MSKVLLDHVPARTPPAPTGTSGTVPSQERSRLEAGVLGLILLGILVFAVGFAAIFPESSGSSAFWPIYRDPSGVFELRTPRGWTVTESGDRVRLSDEDMTVNVGVSSIEGTSVQQLAAERIAEVGDVGAAEAVPLDGTTIDGRSAAAIQELAADDGRLTVRWFVEVSSGTYLTVVATAPAGVFDHATVDEIVRTIRLPGPDASLVEDRIGQSRP